MNILGVFALCFVLLFYVHTNFQIMGQTVGECHCFNFLSFHSLPKMNALKEKFIHKLLCLFPDPHKSFPNLPQTDTYSRKSKSASSYWSFIFPSIGFKGAKIYNHESVYCENFDKDGDLSDKYVDSSPMSNKKDLLKGKNNDKDQSYAKQLSLNTPKKLLHNFTDSTFISPELNEFFESCLPNIAKGCRRVLLYSSLKHGISLRTLLRNSAKHCGPGLLVVGDMQGAVFGGLLDCPLQPTVKRKYQGTNQTFVFTTRYGQPRFFQPTGVNRYYCLCMNDMLALGGGGSSALCLDGELLTGTSGPSDTFGNMCLAHSSEFELKNVELWGFTYACSYNVETSRTSTHNSFSFHQLH